MIHNSMYPRKITITNSFIADLMVSILLHKKQEQNPFL